MNLTVYLFHPYLRRSLVNKAFWEAAQKVDGVTCRNMYDEYPDFNIDLKKEKSILQKTDVLVFQHPFYWYNIPSLMKEWMDVVLEFGYAYGPTGEALKGKSWFQVISIGGPEEAYLPEGYNNFKVEELLRPYEQTAYLCQMNYLSPYLTYGARRIDYETVQKKASEYVEELQKIRSGISRPLLDTRNKTGLVSV